MNRHALALAVIFSAINISASDGAPVPEESSTTIKPVAYPLVMYTPETSLMLGGGAVFVLREKGEAATAKPDNITINAIYTTKSQAVLQMLPEFYLLSEKLKVKGSMLYMDMPTSYFGTGNNGGMSYSAIKSREEKYTNRTLMFQPQATYALWGALRAGMSWDLKNTSIRNKAQGGELAGNTVTGGRGGILSGLGPVLEYDSRDNIFYPREGLFAQAVTRLYRKALGSEYSYNYYALDLRGYREMRDGQVLALQFAAAAAGQDVPFYDMPLYDLRGIYNSYFMNRAAYSAQAEYRFKTGNKFYAVIFAGAGNTAPGAGKLSLKDPQFSGGAGLRYRLDEEEKINFRLDVGVSKWGVEPYFGITEAF